MGNMFSTTKQDDPTDRVYIDPVPSGVRVVQDHAGLPREGEGRGSCSINKFSYVPPLSRKLQKGFLFNRTFIASPKDYTSGTGGSRPEYTGDEIKGNLKETFQPTLESRPTKGTCRAETR